MVTKNSTKLIVGFWSLVTVSLVGMEQPVHPALESKIYKIHAYALLDHINSLAKKLNKSDDALYRLLTHFLTKHVINKNTLDEKSRLFIEGITLYDIKKIDLSEPRKEVRLLFWWYVKKMVLFGVLKNVGCSYQDISVPGVVALEKVSQYAFEKKVQSLYQPVSKDFVVAKESKAFAEILLKLLKEKNSQAEITNFFV